MYSSGVGLFAFIYKSSQRDSYSLLKSIQTSKLWSFLLEDFVWDILRALDQAEQTDWVNRAIYKRVSNTL